MGVENINDRNCVCFITYIKRNDDRACIQTDPQRMFEVQEDRPERGKPRESSIYL